MSISSGQYHNPWVLYAFHNSLYLSLFILMNICVVGENCEMVFYLHQFQCCFDGNWKTLGCTWKCGPVKTDQWDLVKSTQEEMSRLGVSCCLMCIKTVVQPEPTKL